MLSLLNTTFTNTLRQGFTLIGRLLSKLKARSTYFENKAGTKVILQEIDSAGLLEKASIITTPTAYSDGVLHSVKPEQTFGSELVTNGDFGNDTNNWTPNSNATLTIDNDKLKVTINGASGYPSQSITTEIGKTYRITANSFIGTSSRLALYNTGDGQFRNLYEDGSFDFTITAASTSTQLRLYVYGDGSYGLWDNISVKEVTDADFTFTRNSPATRVNSQGIVQSVSILGSNVVTNGNFETNTDWTLGDGWSIGGNKASCDGTQTNTTNIVQTISTNIQNQLVKISFTLDISVGTLSGSLNDSGGTEFDALTTSGNYSVQATSTNANPTILFQGNADFVGSISNVVIQSVTNDTDLAKINYLGGSGSLLLEPEATNTATDSNDFTTGQIFVSSSNASLTNGVTLTANATTSPEGLTNASKLQIGTTNQAFNRLRYAGVITVSGNINTLSIFAKKGSGVDWFGIFVDGIDASSRGWFDLENGVLGSKSAAAVNHKIEDYGNGWYRCSLSFSTVNDTNGVVSFVITDGNGNTSYSGNLTDHHFIYGLQAESHATRQYATSYIPTSGGTVTRAEDSALNAGSSDLISSTEGVLYAEIAALNSINNFESIGLSNGGVDERIRFMLNSIENTISVQVTTGGSNVLFRSRAVSDITAFNKLAIKYKQDDYAIWINGVEEHAITSGAVPTLNQLNFSSGANFNLFKGNVKCVAVFKEALTDAELTCLTT